MTEAQDQWLRMVTGIGALPAELILEVAKNLSPIDQLALSHANSQQYSNLQLTKELRDGRERAIRVQAIWRRLTAPRSDGVDPITVLVNTPNTVATLAPSFDCLSQYQHQQLVTAAEGITNQFARATALAGFGPGLAALAPDLHQRLVTAAEGITKDYGRANALAGFGPGLAALAPELHQRLVTAIEGITDEFSRARALVNLAR
jgi:hypothetical protein